MKPKALKIRDDNGKLVKLDAFIERVYYANCSGVQINIMDIGKVFKAGEAAFLAGGTLNDVRDAVLAKVAEIRLN